MKMKPRSVVLGTVLLAAPWAAAAQHAPPGPEATPAVYKVIAEDGQFRVIEAVWAPGQKDEWHSHPAGSAIYPVTDCQLRFHTPDGKVRNVAVKAGVARMGNAIDSHFAENIGQAECKVVLFEHK